MVAAAAKRKEVCLPLEFKATKAIITSTVEMKAAPVLAAHGNQNRLAKHTAREQCVPHAWRGTAELGKNPSNQPDVFLPRNEMVDQLKFRGRFLASSRLTVGLVFIPLPLNPWLG